MARAAVKVKSKVVGSSAGLLVSWAVSSQQVSRRSFVHCRSLFGETEINKAAPETEVLQSSLKSGDRAVMTSFWRVLKSPEFER